MMELMYTFNEKPIVGDMHLMEQIRSSFKQEK